MTTFVRHIAEQYEINQDSYVYEYIVHKTQASDRGSKARRSLGNLYALYVLCNDFLVGNKEGSSFTYLMGEMKAMPFGSKLQNHPLDNRLNGEVKKRYVELSDQELPVQDVKINGKKGRKISGDFLSLGGDDPIQVATFIVRSIEEYISIIEKNQNEYLEKVVQTESSEEIVDVINDAFNYESDARLFEIVSHALLYIHYKKKTVCFCDEHGRYNKINYTLYKTGRTNANDGGIDFVLRPMGRFFQVTETLDFKKYFLDLDKMTRYPITFVIKTELSSNDVMNKIEKDAKASIDAYNVDTYLSLFEEVITLKKLRSILEEISQSPEEISELKETVISSYKLEYGLLD
ncbi:hypothetical protein [Photobacterium phosphoreum]|uniref:hypothetical protein n=1 Tax=Photobacterium phosphoreum TaxID=659 RepID=UPI00242DF55C|nr:hypothetical protein [Photobacterium phosphoreum]